MPKFTHTKFNAIVAQVYTEAVPALPIVLSREGREQDIFNSRVSYPTVSKLLFERCSKKVEVRFINGFVRVHVLDSNGLYALRDWRVEDLEDLGRVMLAAARILDKCNLMGANKQ